MLKLHIPAENQLTGIRIQSKIGLKNHMNLRKRLIVHKPMNFTDFHFQFYTGAFCRLHTSI